MHLSNPELYDENTRYNCIDDNFDLFDTVECVLGKVAWKSHISDSRYDKLFALLANIFLETMNKYPPS